MKKYAFFLIFFLCKIFVGFAQNATEASIISITKEILQAETERFGMMTTKDIVGLKKVLAEELTYVHSTGMFETKEQFIESLRTNKILYKSIQARDVVVRVYGSTGMVTGIAAVKAWTKGKDVEMQVRYTEVYVKKDGIWQLVGWQSTLLMP